MPAARQAIIEQISQNFLPDRLALFARDDGELASRPRGDRLLELGQDRNCHPGAGLFGVDRDDAVPDMLLAQPGRVPTAQAGIKEHVKHDPFPRASRPPVLEPLELFFGPDREALGLRLGDGAAKSSDPP
jgi:hypothetical protein